MTDEMHGTGEPVRRGGRGTPVRNASAPESVAAQQKRLDRLQDDLTSVLQQLKRKPGDDMIEPHDTRPPHWGG